MPAKPVEFDDPLIENISTTTSTWSGSSVSIIIKTLNEEEKIGRCLESVISAARHVPCQVEIILADSLSSDLTVSIARNYPVKIVQLALEGDRSCGAGAQLGFQYSIGDFICIFDGDMVMNNRFLPAAIGYLESNPAVAGVGGILTDLSVRTPADRWRRDHYARINHRTDVEYLGGGGVYRRRAIDEVGHFSNRYLQAGEEAELGARLRYAGWKLVRLPCEAASHEGHLEGGFAMLMRLWKSGRMTAYGQLLRVCLQSRCVSYLFPAHWFLLAAFVVNFLAIASAIAVASAIDIAFLRALAITEAVAWFAVLGALLVRGKSLAEAGFAIVSWHIYALATVIGLLKAAGNPGVRIPSTVIQGDASL